MHSAFATPSASMSCGTWGVFPGFAALEVVRGLATARSLATHGQRNHFRVPGSDAEAKPPDA